jgi:hypothetical protein
MCTGFDSFYSIQLYYCGPQGLYYDRLVMLYRSTYSSSSDFLVVYVDCSYL